MVAQRPDTCLQSEIAHSQRTSGWAAGRTGLTREAQQQIHGCRRTGPPSAAGELSAPAHRNAAKERFPLAANALRTHHLLGQTDVCALSNSQTQYPAPGGAAGNRAGCPQDGAGSVMAYPAGYLQAPARRTLIANVGIAAPDRRPPRCTARARSPSRSRVARQTPTPCPRWDSNPDLTDFKSAASADWATGASAESSVTAIRLWRRCPRAADAITPYRARNCGSFSKHPRNVLPHRSIRPQISSVKTSAADVKKPLTRYAVRRQLRKPGAQWNKAPDITTVADPL